MMGKSKTPKYLCLSCVHFKQEYQDGAVYLNAYGYPKYEPESITYSCERKVGYLQKLRTKCKKYLSRQQQIFVRGDNGMVKIDSIEVEAERIDLKDLPKTATLLAVEEKVQEATQGRTGGIVITYKLEDGRQFPQKYSPVSATVLVKALRKLKLSDTTDLQNAWYDYELTPMRIGFARMIPVKKAKDL